MLKLGPSVKQLFHQTQELMKSGLFEEALESARLLLAQDDKSFEHWMLEGAIRVALGEWRPAERAYQRACKEAPKNSIPLLQCANLSMALGQPGDAFDYAEQALNLAAQAHERRDAYHIQAEALFSSAQSKLAARLTELGEIPVREEEPSDEVLFATEYSPGMAEIWEQPSISALHDPNVKLDLETGLDFVGKAIEMDASVPEIWDLQGSFLRMLGRVDDSVQAWRKATSIDPTNADSWHKLGLALLALQQTKEAREVFERVYELDVEQGAEDLAFLPNDFKEWVEQAWSEVEEEWLATLNIDLPILIRTDLYPAQEVLKREQESVFDPRSPLLIDTILEAHSTTISITLYQQNVEREALTMDPDEFQQTLFHLLEETIHTFLDHLSEGEQ